MSVLFDSKGKRIPTTLILAEPNVVFVTKEGKIQLGFGKKKKPKKPQNHYLSAFGFAPKRIKEVKSVGDSEAKTGDLVTVSNFKRGDLVKVTGTSKGKGFAGGMKRWGFKGGPKTHGQSDRHRAPGSIGQTTTPGRVFKGKKMAGHLGNVQKTTRNLEVINVDQKNNMLIVKGAVPGTRNGFVVVEKIGELKQAREIFGQEQAPAESLETDSGGQEHLQQEETQTGAEAQTEASNQSNLPAEDQSQPAGQKEEEQSEEK